MPKPTPWYRIATWAREGNWESHYCGVSHLTFVKDDDLIEVMLEKGRLAKAEWHNHTGDECRILRRAYNTGSSNVSIETWFK